MNSSTDRIIEDLRKEITLLRQEYDEFAYAVSHDLRSPLRAIANLTNWVAEDIETEDEEVTENLVLLRSRAIRLEKMVEGILQFSRIHRFDLELSTFEVQETVQQVVDPLLPWQGNITVNCEVTAKDTYKKKFSQLCHYLIDNAIQYNDKGDNGKISVEATGNDEGITLAVADNGLGIDKHDINEVFKVFYTVHAKDEKETTGMGLTLAKKLVDFVGGWIKLSSELGAGTTVTVFWPIKHKNNSKH